MKVNCINCHCGHRIVAKDLLQRNWYARVFGPSFMYLRYRCARCRRIGEKFIEQDQWDDSMLREVPAEVSLRERKRFENLGGISVDEEIQFHFELDKPDALRRLLEGVKPGTR
jgi:DNA-directed RNA polymerase subunit RPC12/RpoP